MDLEHLNAHRFYVCREKSGKEAHFPCRRVLFRDTVLDPDEWVVSVPWYIHPRCDRWVLEWKLRPLIKIEF